MRTNNFNNMVQFINTVKLNQNPEQMVVNMLKERAQSNPTFANLVALAEQGKNPFTLDSKVPDWSKFQDFIKGEVRYSSLMKSFPEVAGDLFAKTEEFAKLRYESYRKLSL